MAAALGVPAMRVVETGGDSFEAEREQWDDGSNVIALEPGVVVAYERKPLARSARRHVRLARAGGDARRPVKELRPPILAGAGS